MNIKGIKESIIVHPKESPQKRTTIQFDLTLVQRRLGLALISSSAGFFFLNFFEPFGLYHNSTLPKNEVFIEVFVAMTFAFVTIIISQFVVRPLLGQLISSLWQILSWFLIEAGLTASIWTFLDYLSISDQRTDLLWFENFIAYITVLGLPYIIYHFILYVKDIKNPSQEKNSTADLRQLTIQDEFEEVKLIIPTSSLLFIKSADNYVEINYLENDTPRQELIRNTIKNLEQQLKDEHIMRCHRSYMINIENISSAKKSKSGFELRLLKMDDLIIPVSKSYLSELKKKVSIIR